ncbi:hypothetical protein YC2023_083846 [Brassica napus]
MDVEIKVAEEDNVKTWQKIIDSEDILSACLVTLVTKPQRKKLTKSRFSLFLLASVGSETQYGTVQRVMSSNTSYYRSPFGDTTFTKVFVGGLAWETPTEEMRRYFEQFGEILEAVIITDKITGKSKGYGFVTFREPESATRAVADPNPVIDGRKANCNIASFGQPRPSTPRGRGQGGSPSQYQGGGQSGYSGMPGSLQQAATAQLMYPSYGSARPTSQQNNNSTPTILNMGTTKHYTTHNSNKHKHNTTNSKCTAEEKHHHRLPTSCLLLTITSKLQALDHILISIMLIILTISSNSNNA